MNFIGRYYHALEQKGRIAIPASFRKSLGSDPILTRGLEGCLFLFPKDKWEKAMIGTTTPFTKKDVREWTRLMVHNAQPASLDGQGRILIQENLKSFAHLEQECVIAGSVDYIEIWDKATYHTYMDRIESQAESIAERIQQGNHE